MDIDEAIRRMFLAGVGAISMTGEKAKELVEELVKRGEISVAQGKALTEELQRKLRSKVKSAVGCKPENIADCVEQMSASERAALRKKLDEMDQKESRFAEDVGSFFHEEKK